MSADQRGRLEAASADLDPPFAVLDLDAFDANAGGPERSRRRCAGRGRPRCGSGTASGSDAKAGELCEHVDVLHTVDGDGRTGATSRGEGRAFG